MKAVRLNAFNTPLSVETVDEPKLVSHSVILRVVGAHVTSSSKTLLSGQDPHIKPVGLPMTPGCNLVGVIEELADDVFDLKKGQLVVCDPLVFSTESYSTFDGILLGWFPLSADFGRHVKNFNNGGWAEKVLVPAANILPLPDSLSVKYPISVLATLPYNSVAYGGLVRGGMRPGNIVVVNGATGTIGSAAVVFALGMGASRVIAVGRNQEVLSKLSSIDHRVVTVALTDNIEEGANKIKSLASEVDHPKRLGAHLVIDAVGMANSADASIACLGSLRPRGVFVILGSLFAPFNIPYMDILSKEIEIRGSAMVQRSDMYDLMQLISSGLISLEHFKVTAFPLNQFQAAIDLSPTKGLDNVVLEPNK